MNTLNYAQETALKLERLYRSRDVVAQRAATMAKLQIRAHEAAIDIGSGPGFLCEDIAEQTGAQGRVLGIDISQDLIDLSLSRNRFDWLAYSVGDATALPADDASFDVAACTQVAEYVADVEKALSEIFRVLKPGGRTIVVATDWDTVAWNTEDPERMARVMRAWEGHCAHPRLPRRLANLLRTAGFEVTDVSLFPLVNMRFDEDAYSFGISQLIHDFVVKGKHLTATDADAWRAEMASLDAKHQYYFTSGRMLFSARKPA